MNEFELIARYFTPPARRARVGVGDDCAVLAVTPGHELAISTDMLVAGRHFLPDTDAQALGHKTLAVNLSDLAACGALPRYALLALALPEVEQDWLENFARGFFALAEVHEVELIGGDTTRGPLNLCVTVLGEVPAGQALLRSGARPGDEIWVSGCLGDAALGLAHLLGKRDLDAAAKEYALARLHRPMPRVALGQALRGLAHAAIDVSDGFLGDLTHILAASACSATIELDALPRSAALRACPDATLARDCLLAGGDDYELCFTAAPEQDASIVALGAQLGLAVTRVGRVESGQAGTLRLIDHEGREVPVGRRGFDHFSGN
ncbi:MAG: thiamine-phosphate kinase [Burkholderiales bacterium]|nr:MAG: thiamine-phosphate kinase [Burkholderiales bacterium]